MCCSESAMLWIRSSCLMMVMAERVWRRYVIGTVCGALKSAHGWFSGACLCLLLRLRGPAERLVKMPRMRMRGQAVDPRHDQRRRKECHVNDHLPHHRVFGVLVRVDEGFQQMDGRNADERHGQLDLQHTCVHVIEPFRLVGVAFHAES